MDCSARQLAMFSLGWVAYGSTYFLRKPIGVIKSLLQTDLGITLEQLGWFDISLLLPYAMGQIFLSSIGDRFGATATFASCLTLSGFSMCTFGEWNSVWIMCFLLACNGLTQSLCWPSCTKILSTWFSDAKRNTVFGLFGTCAFAGGIIGTTLAVGSLHTFGSWRFVHYIPSIIVILLGLVVYFFYKPNEEKSSTVTLETGPSDVERQQVKPTLSLMEIKSIPGVMHLAFSVFCLKMVRYAMYMWLPIYLRQKLDYSVSVAGLFSTAFEVGGVAGSALLGFLLDKYMSHSPLLGVTGCIVFSAIAFVIFILTSQFSQMFSYITLFLGGAFNCGSDIMLGAAIPSKIGQMENRNAGAAVTGLVNGFGYLGTVLEGPIIAYMSASFGWSAMFYLTVTLTSTAALVTFLASMKVRLS